jgi:integrase
MPVGKRGNKYVVKVPRPGKPGRTVQVGTFDRKKEADEALKNDLSAIGDKRFMARSDSVTFGHAALEFLRGREVACRLGKAAGNTVENYRHCIEYHLVPEFDGYKLCDLNNKTFQKFVDDMALAGSKAMHESVAVAIKEVLKFATEQGWYVPDPREKKLRARRVPAEIVVPERQDLAAYMDSLKVKHGRERPFAREIRQAAGAMGLYAGLREGEVCGLQWENVDLVAGVIKVRHSLSRHGGLKGPKTKAGIRDVPMHQEVYEALVPIWERRRRPEVGYVLLIENDTDIRDTFWTTFFVPSMRWAGLMVPNGKGGLKPKFSFHELRHAFVSLLREMGYSWEKIATIVGHSNGTFTAKVYGHLFPDADE